MNLSTRYMNLSTESMQNWLNNHEEAVAMQDAGYPITVGQIDRDKAQRFRMEIYRRSIIQS